MSDKNEILTQWLHIPVEGDTSHQAMPAFLARPAGRGEWPAVVLGFEMFGVTGYLREVAAQVASAGYLAVVPDFYHWQSAGDSHTELAADADGRARGLELVNGLQRWQVEADVRATIAALAARPDCTGETAMIGLSAGGHIAYYAATQAPLAALAVFYPGWLTSTEIGLSRPEPVLDATPGLAALGTPVLMLAGEDDHLYAPGDLTNIGDRLTQEGVRHDLVIYPDTPHGFACFERDTYRPEAAADAWARTFRLLAGNIGSGTIAHVH